MTTDLKGLVSIDTADFVGIDATLTTQKQLSIVETKSIPDGCIERNYSALGYVPWDNPDNVVSIDVEVMSVRVQQNILAILLLIGGPANVINMVVFYTQGLKDRVNLCLFALSLSDLLYLITATSLYAEHIVTQFSSAERYGPVTEFIINNNLMGFFGFQWVSQVLTAIIASERCFCVLCPLKFQAMFRTRTMAILIITVYIVVVGLFFVVSFVYRVACVYNPFSGSVTKTFVTGELYETHKVMVSYLNGLVFGGVLPGVVLIVVTTTTIITTIKLRQIVTWRSESSTSLSAREVALTKMLVANSIFFTACVVPDAIFRIACFFLPEMSMGRRNQNLYLSFVWSLDIITYINSTFNMFLFYAMGTRFRETFWSLFKRKSQPGKGKHTVAPTKSPTSSQQRVKTVCDT